MGNFDKMLLQRTEEDEEDMCKRRRTVGFLAHEDKAGRLLETYEEEESGDVDVDVVAEKGTL